ncbi:Tfp pilus assembly protein FimT/FimU [Patescibacteria group bacterium]
MKNKKGTTLIELIIYVGMLAVMSVSIAFFTASFFRWSSRGAVVAEVEQQGVFVSRLIFDSIVGARAINSPVQAQSDTSLSLDVIDSNDDPTIFEVASGALRIKEGGSNWVDLTNSKVVVSDFSVKNLSGSDTPGVVRVIFTLKYDNPGSSSYNYARDFYVTASIR